MDDFMYMDYRYPSLILFWGIIAIAIGIVYLIISIIFHWKMFKKAGKSGWECIIPFYSYFVLTEIAGLNWWWFLLAIIDSIVTLIDLENLSTIANLVGLFARFNIYYNIAKKFNKSNGTAVCVGIISGIFILIFGFSKNAVYNANIPVSKNGIFGAPETSNNTYNNQSNVNVQPVYNNNVAQPMVNTVNQDQSTQGNNSDSVTPVEETSINSNVDNAATQEFSFCGNCGTKLNKDARFCPNCGRENN